MVYREGFVKNRYVGRTHHARQAHREICAEKTLGHLYEFEGKRSCWLTIPSCEGPPPRKIVEMARDRVLGRCIASAAPPVRHPNVYGIDMPAVDEFIANGRNIEEINDIIGSDRLFYQTLEDLIDVTSIGPSPPSVSMPVVLTASM